MNIYLKIKIKTLVAEAQFIRREERKVKTSRAYRRNAKRLMRLGNEVAKGSFEQLTNAERVLAIKQAQTPSPEATTLHSSLQSHRKNVVGDEARSAHLAYAFLRGHAYKDVEKSAKFKPDWTRIAQIVKKFSETDRTAEFVAWQEEANK